MPTQHQIFMAMNARATARDEILNTAMRNFMSDSWVGMMVQTIPGVGTLANIKQSINSEKTVLNCFWNDDEFLRDVNKVLFKQPPGGIIIFDVHEEAFVIDDALAACLFRLVRQGGKYIFVSRKQISMDRLENPLLSRTFRLDINQ